MPLHPEAAESAAPPQLVNPESIGNMERYVSQLEDIGRSLADGRTLDMTDCEPDGEVEMMDALLNILCFFTFNPNQLAQDLSEEQKNRFAAVIQSLPNREISTDLFRNSLYLKEVFRAKANIIHLGFTSPDRRLFS